MATPKQFFGGLWLDLVVAGLYATGQRVFPIVADTKHHRRFSRRHGPRFWSQRQQTVDDEQIAHLTPQSDNSILWKGRCLEGDKHVSVVRARFCTGGQNQKWNWLPWDRGSRKTQHEIQLDGTHKCLGIAESNVGTGSNGFFKLRECESNSTEMLVEVDSPAKVDSLYSTPATSLRRLMIFFIVVLTLLGIFAFRAQLWRWQKKKCAVTFGKDMDDGGVCLATLMAVRPGIVPRTPHVSSSAVPAVMARNLTPAQDDVPRQVTESEALVTVPLKRLKSGTGQFGGRFAAVDLSLGSESFTAMIDTALTTDLLLTPDRAKALKAPRQGVVCVQASSSKLPSEVVLVPPGLTLSASTNTVSLPAIQAMVANFPQERMDPEVPTEGMIGIAPFWERFDVDLDFGSGVLRLYQMGDGAVAATQAGLTALRATPMEGVNLPAVRVIAPDGQAMLGLVDSGSGSTIANASAAKLLDLKPDTQNRLAIADTGMLLKVAPGVPLPLGDLKPPSDGGVYTAAGELRPKFVTVGDLPAFTQLAGPDRPALVLGLDVLGSRRLFFCGGDEGHDRTLFIG